MTWSLGGFFQTLGYGFCLSKFKTVCLKFRVNEFFRSEPTFHRVRKRRIQQPASAAVNCRSGAPKKVEFPGSGPFSVGVQGPHIFNLFFFNP
jgi:hypothetical protein